MPESCGDVVRRAASTVDSGSIADAATCHLCPSPLLQAACWMPRPYRAVRAAEIGGSDCTPQNSVCGFATCLSAHVDIAFRRGLCQELFCATAGSGNNLRSMPTPGRVMPTAFAHVCRAFTHASPFQWFLIRSKLLGSRLVFMWREAATFVSIAGLCSQEPGNVAAEHRIVGPSERADSNDPVALRPRTQLPGNDRVAAPGKHQMRMYVAILSARSLMN